MKIWIDTENLTVNYNAQLISLGAVREDGKEFYAISDEFDPADAKEWIRKNVLSSLENRESGYWKSRKQIREDFCAFAGTDPLEVWSLNGGVDWYLVTHLFENGWDGIPENWPYHFNDLTPWAMKLGSPEFPKQMGTAHNALADARWHKEIYDFLTGYERTQQDS